MFENAASQRLRWVGAWSILMSCLLPFACSKDEDGLPDITPPPCEGPSCGAPCSETADCQGGFYCANAKCERDCLQGSTTCGAGKACSQDGRCVSTGTGTAGGGSVIIPPNGGSGGGTGSMPDACAAVSVEFDSEVPNVLLLVDQSGSMTANFGGTPRWTALRNALIAPMTGLVPRLQAQVNFGMTLYTSPNEDGQIFPDAPPVQGCPTLTTVPIAANNLAAIEPAYLPVMMPPRSTGNTPTGESLQAAVASLAALDQTQFPGRRVIVLATDGEPDTCAEIDPMTNAERQAARQVVVDAATAAFQQGITVYVISVGDEVGEDHLREVANAGQGIPVDDPMTRFYSAADASQLEMAFGDIVNDVRNCVFTLEGEVTGPPSSGMVSLDGATVTFGDANGWRLNGPSEVEILGTACEAIKTGDHDIQIRFPCEDVVIIPK